MQVPTQKNRHRRAKDGGDFFIPKAILQEFYWRSAVAFRAWGD
jgi:hypothetical protein